jgi:hypothetical protein
MPAREGSIATLFCILAWADVIIEASMLLKYRCLDKYVSGVSFTLYQGFLLKHL